MCIYAGEKKGTGSGKGPGQPTYQQQVPQVPSSTQPKFYASSSGVGRASLHSAGSRKVASLVRLQHAQTCNSMRDSPHTMIQLCPAPCPRLAPTYTPQVEHGDARAVAAAVRQCPELLVARENNLFHAVARYGQIAVLEAVLQALEEIREIRTSNGGAPAGPEGGGGAPDIQGQGQASQSPSQPSSQAGGASPDDSGVQAGPLVSPGPAGPTIAASPPASPQGTGHGAAPASPREGHRGGGSGGGGVSGGGGGGGVAGAASAGGAAPPAPSSPGPSVPGLFPPIPVGAEISTRVETATTGIGRHRMVVERQWNVAKQQGASSNKAGPGRRGGSSRMRWPWSKQAGTPTATSVLPEVKDLGERECTSSFHHCGPDQPINHRTACMHGPARV